ncbi:MAG: biotin/lipoyl-binding protein [Spirochaetaceae bacterium]|nr:biotin/lipoyl-binding protein [Spirochaetaceae bacterium]
MKSYDFKVGGQSFTARIVEYTESRVVVDLNGNTYDVELSSETTVAPASAITPPAPKKVQPQRVVTSTQTPVPAAGTHDTGAVTAPIPGVVKQIPVAVGDEVTEGKVVLILEAMKMENQISATVGGTISEIKVALGDSVHEGQLLIQIEAS